jgi:hypothetical protein
VKNLLLLLFVLCTFAGCSTRETKENTTQKEEKVVKVTDNVVIDAVVTVPNLGDMPIKGNFKRTTYQEEVTTLEAIREQTTITTYPLAEKVAGSVAKAAANFASGNVMGGFQELYMLISTALNLVSTGVAAKKHGEAKELKGRVTRAENNEDEVFEQNKQLTKT